MLGKVDFRIDDARCVAMYAHGDTFGSDCHVLGCTAIAYERDDVLTASSWSVLRQMPGSGASALQGVKRVGRVVIRNRKQALVVQMK